MELAKSRQVHGKMSGGEGEVPPVEITPSCEATMFNEMKRGTKFDDPGPDVLGQGSMEEEHTSRTR